MRRMYGVLERQFRNYFEKAAQKKGITGETLLQLLESRLDNVVYRMGFASSRAEARQLVRHNGDPGQRQAGQHPVLPAARGGHRQGAREIARPAAHQGSLELAEANGFPSWVEVDPKASRALSRACLTARRLPPT